MNDKRDEWQNETKKKMEKKKWDQETRDGQKGDEEKMKERKNGKKRRKWEGKASPSGWKRMRPWKKQDQREIWQDESKKWWNRREKKDVRIKRGEKHEEVFFFWKNRMNKMEDSQERETKHREKRCFSKQPNWTWKKDDGRTIFFFSKSQKEIQRNNFGDIRKGCFCPERKVYFFERTRLKKVKKKKKQKGEDKLKGFQGWRKKMK